MSAEGAIAPLLVAAVLGFGKRLVYLVYFSHCQVGNGAGNIRACSYTIEMTSRVFAGRSASDNTFG
jgi:hypothetical protein